MSRWLYVISVAVIALIVIFVYYPSLWTGFFAQDAELPGARIEMRLFGRARPVHPRPVEQTDGEHPADYQFGKVRRADQHYDVATPERQVIVDARGQIIADQSVSERIEVRWQKDHRQPTIGKLFGHSRHLASFSVAWRCSL